MLYLVQDMCRAVDSRLPYQKVKKSRRKKELCMILSSEGGRYTMPSSKKHKLESSLSGEPNRGKNKNPIPSFQMLRLSEVASILGVHPRTVQRWIATLDFRSHSRLAIQRLDGAATKWSPGLKVVRGRSHRK